MPESVIQQLLPAKMPVVTSGRWSLLAAEGEEATTISLTMLDQPVMVLRSPVLMLLGVYISILLAHGPLTVLLT